MRRALDVLTLLYFAVHVPITILFDSQVLLPACLYPTQLKAVYRWYVVEFKDAMMNDPPAWFCSFCVCELFLQMPFFFVAISAYWKGAEASKWIRIPNLVYSTHVATTVVAIVAHIMFEDFSEYKIPTPQTLQERLILIGIYLPFLVVPFIMMLDTLFSSAYREKSKQN